MAHLGGPASEDAVDDEIEIGWCLRKDAWRRGYATEAAQAALAWAWAETTAPRIVALTVPANRRSRAVMARSGLTRRAELDFAHPAFADGHRLRAHIVHAVDRPGV